MKPTESEDPLAVGSLKAMEVDKSGRVDEERLEENPRMSSAKYVIGAKKFENDEEPLLYHGKLQQPTRRRKRLMLTTCALAFIARGDLEKCFEVGARGYDSWLSKASISIHIIWILPALVYFAIRLKTGPYRLVKILTDAGIVIVSYMSRHLKASIATEVGLVAFAHACLLLLRCVSKLEDNSNEDAVDLFFQEMVETWDVSNTSLIRSEGYETLDILS